MSENQQPDPYGQPNPYYGQAPQGQAPYGQTPYGQQPQQPVEQNAFGQPVHDPYARADYGQPTFGQPGYPGPYAQAPYAQVPPKHPQATTALVLGIISLAGAMFCLVPILLAPFAWFTGSRAVKQIDASNGALTGRDSAMVGKVLGIVGTVLLILGVLVVTALFVWAVSTTSVVWEETSRGPGVNA